MVEALLTDSTVSASKTRAELLAALQEHSGQQETIQMTPDSLNATVYIGTTSTARKPLSSEGDVREALSASQQEESNSDDEVKAADAAIALAFAKGRHFQNLQAVLEKLKPLAHQGLFAIRREQTHTSQGIFESGAIVCTCAGKFQPTGSRLETESGKTGCLWKVRELYTVVKLVGHKLGLN